ncbi:UDP-glucose 4-epimerase [Candidatus Berkelbacteria bacterium CG10_big_fil_rev_8_21_14_0_10_41_12]|uniref:UDP-glucose 4-epimerase n=1 Tax=Candidatus Berkelbacteria bacterium CG10_big_fil_rev_8_21_14_0_10_41_12 TaxID=1974513 RepID=A0A2M6WXD5_9BACT|nr:MAG: UDP-glucose 4-epimerase [Candidatus Berkelbacteria bacterium CG10_big_fil_rev_8_21_14_0_10_41_12]
MSKILVTGGAGFIGSNLVDELMKRNHEISVIDDLSTGKKENVNKRAKFFEADITDKDALDKIFNEIKPEIIFHLAAQASVIVSAQDPVLDIKTNVIGTVNLLSLAKQFGAGKFIFSSTGGAIYGDDASRPTPENSEAKPISPYGIDKLFGEKFIGYFTSEKLRTIILRYANVYGPRQNPEGEAGIVAIFLGRMIKNTPVEIYGDGSHTRDFVYVGDVVEANIKALESDVDGIFNIGTGQETTVNDITKILIGLTNSKSKITHVEYKAKEQAHSCLDINKTKKHLGWKPQVSLKEGLSLTTKWFEEN